MKVRNVLVSAATITTMSFGVFADMAGAAGKGRSWTQNASRAQVAFHCHANNGTGYNLNGAVSGYGCITATGSVHCSSNGNCEGILNERSTPQNRATFRLPQPRLR